jgi:hypothetical protein
MSQVRSLHRPPPHPARCRLGFGDILRHLSDVIEQLDPKLRLASKDIEQGVKK